MQPMGYGVAGGYAPPAGARTYEFNEAENATIAGTARYARRWGVISIVVGVIVLAAGVVLAAMAAALDTSLGGKGVMLGAVGVALVPTSLVYFVGGIFYLRSGRSLLDVVETQGNDIPLLMGAVKSLSRAFMIEAIASAVAFVAGFAIGLVNAAGGH
jgi:hypothetical protein